MISSSNSKPALREQVRSALGKISLAVRTVESMDLCARLEPQLRSAHTILFYAPLADELDVWPLLERTLKTETVCALPAFDEGRQLYLARRIQNLETDVFAGKFGVSEPLPDCAPVAFDSFDLVLVPGMAFDVHGNRLGRGKGFYDRILAEASGVKCGVAYDFQVMESIPTEAHDVKMNFIFTPSRCLRKVA